MLLIGRLLRSGIETCLLACLLLHDDDGE